MRRQSDEENDLPFTGNDLGDAPGTMDKPLDTTDAPGKADSELVEEGLPPDDQLRGLVRQTAG